MLTGVSSCAVVTEMALERYTHWLMDASPEFPINFLKIYRDYERLLTSTRQHGNRAQELESLLGLASASYIISIDEPDFAAQSLELYKQAYRLARALDDKVGMVRSLVPRHNFLDYWPAYRDEVLANTEEALARIFHKKGQTSS